MAQNETRELLLDSANRSAAYLSGLDHRSVFPTSEAVETLVRELAAPLPEDSSEPGDVLALLDEIGSPATVASAGGRYFGFVTGGAMPASLAANYLAGAWDQNAFSWVSSPAAAAFEDVALRWIIDALGLPLGAAGALVTGATMANFTSLAAARSRVLKDVGWNVDADGLFGAPEITVVVGGEAHAVLFKALAMLGLGRNRVIRLAVDDQGGATAIDLPKIKKPAILCLQAGNVNSGAFDDAAPLIEWAHDSGAWVHVDGAFGIWALMSPRHAHLAREFLAANSWALDAHKWLNVPYDCGIAVVSDPEALHDAMSVQGSYLLKTEHRDALDYTPEGSRRARAIEVWAAMKSLGRTGLRNLVERNCRQAKMFADELRAAGADILNDVVLNQVVVAFGDAEQTHKVIAHVQSSGTCWCGGTVWRGRSAMRISVSSWATTDDDVRRSLAAIIAEAEKAIK